MTNPSAITGTTPNPCPSNVDHGGFNTPTIDLINAYEKGDKRLDASIGMVEGKLTDSYALDATGVKSIVDYEPAPGITAYPFIKKYFIKTDWQSNRKSKLQQQIRSFLW